MIDAASGQHALHIIVISAVAVNAQDDGTRDQRQPAKRMRPRLDDRPHAIARRIVQRAERSKAAGMTDRGKQGDQTADHQHHRLNHVE